MKRLFFFLISIAGIFLTSCNGKFKDGTSVFAEGLWLVPAVLITGGAVLIIVSIIASRSGSAQQDLERGTRYSNENVTIRKLAKFKGGVILVLIGIAAWIGINYFRA